MAKNADEKQTPSFFPLRKHDRGEYLFKLPNTPLNLKETPELNKDNNPYRGLEPFEAKHSKLFFGRKEITKELFVKVIQNFNQLTVVSGISGSGKSSLVKAGLIPIFKRLESQTNYKISLVYAYLLTKEIIKEIPTLSIKFLPINFIHRWYVLEPIRPGLNAYDSLIRVLSSLKKNPTEREEPLKLIQDWSKQNPKSRLLLVIDQFEELITLAPRVEKATNSFDKNWFQKFRDKIPFAKQKYEPKSETPEVEIEQWTGFIELLTEILKECPQLSLVITLRSDFEPRFQNSAFSNDWADARFVVRPMRSDQLREAVEKPAAEKALYFDPSDLVDRLVDEVSQMPGALPLLSFTLSEMYIQLFKAWRDNGKEDRSLTVEDNFDSEGGVAGALTRSANNEYEQIAKLNAKLKLMLYKLMMKKSSSVFLFSLVFFFEQDLGKLSQLTMRRVMLRMLELEGGEAVRRRVLKSELTYPSDEENERVKTVLARLQQARLIVTGTDVKANEPYYEPAHDYLVRGWERLQVWITKEQDSLALQDLLTPAAKAWKKENTDLWDTNSRLDRLKEIQDKDTVDDNWLNKIESDFVELSYKTKTRKQRNFRIGSIGFISLLTLISIFAVRFGVQSDRQAKMAKVQELAAKSESTREQKANLHETSFLLALESYKRSYDIHKPYKPSSDADSVLRNGLNFSRHHLFPAIYLVQEIKFSPDGDYFATVNENGLVKLRELNADIDKEIIIPHKATVQEIKFSPDGDYFATVSEDELVKLRELSADIDKEIIIPHKAKVQEIKFSPDGNYFATVSEDGLVKLRELSADIDKEIIISHKAKVQEIKFSSDSNYFASSSSDKTARVRTLNTNIEKEIVIFHQEVVRRIKFSSDNQYIVTVSKDHTNCNFLDPSCHPKRVGTVKLRNLSTGQETIFFNQQLLSQFLPENIEEIEFSPDGKFFAINSWGGKTTLVELSTGKKTEHSPKDYVEEIEFSSDSKYFATAIDRDWHPLVPSDDVIVRILELSTDREIVLSHKGYVRQVKFSSGDKYFASASSDGTATLVELSTGQQTIISHETASLSHEGKVQEIEFSSDSKYFATRSGDGTATLIELSTGKKNIVSHEDEVREIKFSSDSKYFATRSDDGTAQLVELDTGKKTIISYQSKVEKVEVQEIKFSSDSKYFATRSDDGIVKLVKLTNDNQYLTTASENVTDIILESPLAHETFISHVDEVNEIRFSSDNQYFATASKDGRAILLEFSSGKKTVISHEYERDIQEIKFSPDNNYLATVQEWTAKLIEVQYPNQVNDISHDAAVTKIEFSSDGKYFATGSGTPDNDNGGAKLIELQHPENEKDITDSIFTLEIEFSSDGNYFATFGWDGEEKVKVVDLNLDQTIISDV